MTASEAGSRLFAPGFPTGVHESGEGEIRDVAAAETLESVKKIVRASLHIGPEAPLGDDMPLIGNEYDLDSLDVLLVVTTIEKEFGMKFPDRAISAQAFQTIRSLADFVESHRS